MTMVWSSSLATGIREIDLQHQELIAIINDLEQASRDGKRDAVLGDILPRLKAYVMFHFATEESMMKNASIPFEHFSAHEAGHQEFSNRIKSWSSDADVPASLEDFADYLNTWLTSHIMKTDMELATLLRQRSTRP